jgi:hypothetical protein
MRKSQQIKLGLSVGTNETDRHLAAIWNRLPEGRLRQDIFREAIAIGINIAASNYRITLAENGIDLESELSFIRRKKAQILPNSNRQLIVDQPLAARRDAVPTAPIIKNDEVQVAPSVTEYISLPEVDDEACKKPRRKRIPDGLRMW